MRAGIRFGVYTVAFSLFSGAAITLLLVDYTELIGVYVSDWCDAFIKSPPHDIVDEAAFVWRCYDAKEFWEFAGAFGAIVLFVIVVVGGVTWIAQRLTA